MISSRSSLSWAHLIPMRPSLAVHSWANLSWAASGDAPCRRLAMGCQPLELCSQFTDAYGAGCQVVGGVGMLEQQGVVNYELFVGKELPLAEFQAFQVEQA